MQSPSPRSVRIFVASSAELVGHRDAFDLHVRKLNDRYIKRGLHLEPVRWEHFLDAMAPERLQDEYNCAIVGCEVFVMLFRTKVGLYTTEEFEKAFGQFKAIGKPRIYTYFHDVDVKTGSVDRKDMQSLWAFQDRLKALGHFQTVYQNTEGLLLHFSEQLEKLYEAGAFGTAGAAPGPPPPQAESPIAYLTRRAAHWREGAAGQLDRRFINLTLMFDHRLEVDCPRHEAQGRYTLLSELLGERPDVGAWVMVGAPGADKSTVLQHHEMHTAVAALQALGAAAAGDRVEGSSASKPEVCIWHRLSEYDAEKSPPPAEWLGLPTRWPAELPPLAALCTTVRVRFLLDGLNEIKAPSRTQQLQAVDRWTEWAAAESARGDGLAPVFSVRTLDQSPMSTSGFEVRQIVLAPWEPAQIEAYCQAQLGHGNALWPTLEGDAQLLELSKLPFNLWAQCELFRALGRAARDRAELMGGLFWQMLAKRVNDAPLKLPGLLGDKDRAHIASGQWKQTRRALPDREGCLVPWLDHTLQRLHRRGRLVSVPQSELLAGLPACPPAQAGAATPEEWLYAVRSLQLIDEGGHDEFTAEPLLRCTHQLWQEFFAARGIRDWAARHPEQLPDLRPPPLADLDETLARLGLQEPLPGPDPTHWEEPVKLAVQLVKDPAPWIAVLEPVNLALAGRAAVACRARLEAPALDRLRQALLAASRDAGTDLRLRIEAALVLGELGDPRYEARQGPHGRYLWSRHWATVPAGTYCIGDAQAPRDDEKPETEVELQAFEMAFAPVTNAEYRCFVEAGGYQDEQWWQGETARRWLKEGVRNEAEIEQWRGELAAIRSDPAAWFAARHWQTEASRESVHELAQQSEIEHEELLETWYGAQRFELPQEWHNPLFNAAAQPVVGVCQFEALAYARWLQAQCGRPVRLPVEAEWEAAARGLERRRWPWGEAPPGRWQINADPAHLRRTSPVGVFVQGDTPDGLTDLAGDLWQWTTSAYTEALEASALIATAPDGLARRVVRGGSWYYSSDFCRPSFRYRISPVDRNDVLGFRLVVSCCILGP